MSLPPINHETRTVKGKLRSDRHKAEIRKRLCVAWERKECEGSVEVCHLRDIAPNGHGGGRPDDTFTIGMCRKHHRESEKREQAWA